MFPPETSSFLLKNLKYKNKAIGEPKESAPKAQGHLNTAKPAKRGIPNIGNTCYMYVMDNSGTRFCSVCSTCKISVRG